MVGSALGGVTFSLAVVETTTVVSEMTERMAVAQPIVAFMAIASCQRRGGEMAKRGEPVVNRV